MRIAYVCYWNKLSRDGVEKKIAAQTGRWSAVGHEVDVFCLSRAAESHPSWRTVRFSSVQERPAATLRLMREIAARDPDIVYLRYDVFVPPLTRVLRRFPSVIEINADDREEARLRTKRRRRGVAYNAISRALHLRAADGLVCVTHELARSPSFAAFRKPTIVIGNGVDLDVVQPLPAPRNAQPRVAFLGSVNQTWHGVDKLLDLARALPEWEFDIVGYEPGRLPGAPPPNVAAHGSLPREDYEPILGRADVAVGTLGLHRKNMREACPLKVREYLAYGLPTIIGYEDTDFVGETPWFLLRLPNVEQNVRNGVDDVRAFVQSVLGRRVPREQVSDRIGARPKEARRIAFFESVVAARGAPQSSSIASR